MFLIFSFMVYFDLTSQIIAFFSNLQIILQQTMGYFRQQIDYQYYYMVELTIIIENKKLITGYLRPAPMIGI